MVPAANDLTESVDLPPRADLGTDREAVAALGGFEPGDPRGPVTESDRATLAVQLGRPARGLVSIAARCVCSRPLVVRTAPRLEDGTPFPTTYYLTHPVLTAAASTLEAAGVMREMTVRLTRDDELAAAYLRAHELFLASRAELGRVPEIAGISAGGMPTRVKCLHVLVAHALAAGPGVNPLGDEALALAISARLWSPQRCWCAAKAVAGLDL